VTCGRASLSVRSAGANSRRVWPILGALLISLSGCNTQSSRVIEDTFEQLYTIEPSANITIQNGDGAVLVYGSNLNEMRVHAVKKAYTHARLTQIAVNVSTRSGSVSITTKFPPKPTWGLFDRSGTVDYTIVVPAAAGISELNLDAGEILLDGMRGPTTRVRLGEGRMFARNCFTNLEAAIQRGNLILSYDWWEEEQFSVHARVAQGIVWAHLPGEAAFHLLANAGHGQIFNDFKSAAVPAESVDGMKMNALLNNGGRATIKIRVAKGNINVLETNQ
jgi:hypothetical protein